MSSSLDDISFKLGQLDAGQKSLIERADKRDREQAEMKSLLTAISAKLDPVVEEHVWMKPHVENYANVRGGMGWARGMLVFVIGTFGGTLGTWFLKKYGG